MDPFGQQAQAARLLAAAAQVLKQSTQKVRQSYRGQSRPGRVTALGEDLLDTIRSALQLVAAAYGICQQLEQRSRGKAGKASRKPATAGSAAAAPAGRRRGARIRKDRPRTSRRA